ncbi:glycoside hydrolase [Coccomyxa subellipsoidea C-169]|uniref:mannan endo-1,4-beta-mannosidase n=1 Tax=Coccomyxa subellipsoidea (strain C-169) TaxID=574566 RepID=I0ZAC8_COCSC|nr:glycoside hydrolase [Coccomyxa subellipsoidea C-169]EIE27597.1 glycoside hydrolase [Coccomyxa subellipsoidea C-169]|eukprot:XP_005652141.1 glycoside hydrolase [Coccomyxa subellipsoidea C-169]
MHQLIREQMDAAVAAGFTVMRAWSHGVTQNYALQTSPGVYNEAMFRGLDFALDEARQRNVKVLLAFVDNWQSTGGVDEYVKWTGDSTKTHKDFYTDPVIMGWRVPEYKDYVKTVINRVNTINGRSYGNDPTIFAWDLLNEARCQKCANNTIAKWVEEMAPYVKSLDPNHLLTLGEEGFYSTSTRRLSTNPGAENGATWPSEEGQDFIADHASPSIDFATIHSWIDNWQDVDEDFQRWWIRTHVQVAWATLKKPLILEEFGKWLNSTVNATMEQRDKYFGIVYDECENNIDLPGSSLKGVGFWEWFAEGQQGPTSEGGGQGLYGIYESDATFKLIKQNVAFLNSKSAPSPDGCKPKTAPPVPGTGNSTCINTDGGFTCQCWRGFTGDGTKCDATPAVAQLESAYSTEATQGPLICDIKYPQIAPGFVYDPTGSIQKNAFKNGKQDGVGNSAPILSLTQCLIACESAPGCSAVVYSPDDQNCFLKGCPSEYAVSCPVPPTSGSPGGPGGPTQAPPSPPSPPAAPCTLQPWQYNYACTFVQNNPDVMLAPAPNSKVIPKYSAGAGNNVSSMSTLPGTLAGLAPDAAPASQQPALVEPPKSPPPPPTAPPPSAPPPAAGVLPSSTIASALTGTQAATPPIAAAAPAAETTGAPPTLGAGISSVKSATPPAAGTVELPANPSPEVRQQSISAGK